MVQKMLDDLKIGIKDVVGQRSVIQKLDPARYTSETFGLPTIQDILKELEKPGRDPRPEFKTASFLEGVDRLEDLRPGMTLEGVVTNVANFGASSTSACTRTVSSHLGAVRPLREGSA